MTLTQERKHEIVAQFGENDQDTGNTRVQVALLTAAHQRPHRAPARAQEGPPLAPRAAHARRPAPPAAELPAEQRPRGLPRAHQGARPPPVRPLRRHHRAGHAGSGVHADARGRRALHAGGPRSARRPSSSSTRSPSARSAPTSCRSTRRSASDLAAQGATLYGVSCDHELLAARVPRVARRDDRRSSRTSSPRAQTSRAFGAYFEPRGMLEPRARDRRPRRGRRVEHLAESPGPPGANLIFDGLALRRRSPAPRASPFGRAARGRRFASHVRAVWQTERATRDGDDRLQLRHQPRHPLRAEVEDRLHVARHDGASRELAERPEADGVAHGVAHERRAPAVERLATMRVVPQRVRPADLDVDEPVRRLPLPGSACPSGPGRRGAAARYWRSVPTPIAIGSGVSSRKRSSGGVIASRFRGSAKNGKTSSGGASSRCSKRIMWTSGPRIATASYVRTLHADDRPAQRRRSRGPRAPTTTSAARTTPRVVLFYGDFACPKCAVAHHRLKRRARPASRSATSP